jgi:zinc/manganese transport system substrate-binding protein
MRIIENVSQYGIAAIRSPSQESVRVNRHRRPGFRTTIPATVLAVLLSACGNAMPNAAPTVAPVVTSAPQETAPMAPPAAKLKVVATFSIIADFAMQVGGDMIDLGILVPAGSDSHDFEPAPSDAAKIADAGVILATGSGFESWLEALYAASGSRAIRVALTDGITLREGGEHHDERQAGRNAEAATPVAPTGRDPHVWQDVGNAVIMVKNIEAALSKADAANADTYKANAAAYIAKLAALDAEIVNAVAALPEANRRIVTSHDALGYFGARYGIEIVGEVIDSLPTEAGEPSAQEIVKLVKAIKAQGVKAIFPESVTNPKLIERVAQEAGVMVGGELYTDALGEPGSSGATYIDAMRHNVTTLADALK